MAGLRLTSGNLTVARNRAQRRPVEQEEHPPWCTRCGGPVIWMKPPEICLMCKSTAISREEQPDEDPGYFGIHEHTRRFLRAVRYYDRLDAARRAAGGGSDGSS